MITMAMLPEDSVEVFRRTYLPSIGTDASPIKALLQSVLSFYRHEPASGLAEPEGDMLLFQFGTYDWGQGSLFQVDLTRQFVEAERDGDDDVYSQFNLTCYYAPDERLAGLGREHRWCSDPSGLDDFAAWVTAHPVLDAVDMRSREKTEIAWELV